MKKAYLVHILGMIDYTKRVACVSSVFFFFLIVGFKISLYDGRIFFFFLSFFKSEFFFWGVHDISLKSP